MDFLAMIFLMTIVINVRIMLDDELCPYTGDTRERIDTVLKWIQWVTVVLVPIPAMLVSAMNNTHQYLGNFRFVAIVIALFCAIAVINNSIRQRWAFCVDKMDGWAAMFASAFYATFIVMVVASISMLMGSPRFTVGLILGVL